MSFITLLNLCVINNIISITQSVLRNGKNKLTEQPNENKCTIFLQIYQESIFGALSDGLLLGNLVSAFHISYNLQCVSPLMT